MHAFNRHAWIIRVGTAGNSILAYYTLLKSRYLNVSPISRRSFVVNAVYKSQFPSFYREQSSDLYKKKTIPFVNFVVFIAIAAEYTLTPLSLFNGGLAFSPTNIHSCTLFRRYRFLFTQT